MAEKETQRRVGDFNTYEEPIWRRKDNRNNNLDWSYDISTPDYVSGVDTEQIEFNISDANLDSLSSSFLEEYNFLVPIFYSSQRLSSSGGLKLYSPDNITSTLLSADKTIRPLGLCNLLLDDETNVLRLVRGGDTITIKDLFLSGIGLPKMEQFIELWYEEELGFQSRMAGSISNFQYRQYYWYLGSYQLLLRDSENNEFTLRCVNNSNNLYMRR